MLVIRAAQMEVLSSEMRRVFENRMTCLLLPGRSAPLDALSTEEFADLVRRSILRAESYGIVYEDEIERFLRLIAARGREFDNDQDSPTVRGILSNPEMTGDHKVEELEMYFRTARS